MNKAFFLALPLLAAAPLFAQQAPAPQAPGAADIARVTAGTYAIDKSHTQVNWQVNHFGFNDYFGLFGDITGTMTLDPANPAAAKVDIEIPIASVATSSAGLTKHLSTPDFFDTEKFPTARFVSTSVIVDGTKAMIKGDLTMLGVTKPVELEAAFDGAGTNPYSKKSTVGFHAITKIKRSDWGMTKNIPFVGDEVKLRISVAFEKQV
jgi:polyisoprenoid-binding protein YceI